jgi:hypothetical protein
MAESGRSTTLVWRKSTFSGQNECVEVAVNRQSLFVRDSKNTSDPPLEISLNSWLAFLNRVKAG